MPIYITLAKMTPQGATSVKELPDSMKAATSAIEKLGGKVIGVWVTMGQYDLVAVNEFPNDEAVMAFNLAVASRGNASSETLKGFTPEEFAEIVASIPS